jgi:hypothetical protein
MVKVQYYKIDKNAPGSLVADEDRLTFIVPEPTVVQPLEIIRIPLGIVLHLTSKSATLTLHTHPELSQKACELFPSVLVMDHLFPEKELELYVRNSGRNQVNLMQNEKIAVGYVTEIQEFEIEDFAPDFVTQPTLPRTKPQKKGSFNFEIK